MYNCPKCGSVMIRASLYDPDGMIPLYGGIKIGDMVTLEGYSPTIIEWWVCINPLCKDGKKNLR